VRQGGYDRVAYEKAAKGVRAVAAASINIVMMQRATATHRRRGTNLKVRPGLGSFGGASTGGPYLERQAQLEAIVLRIFWLLPVKHCRAVEEVFLPIPRNCV